MVQIGRAIRPLIGARQGSRGIAFMKAHHRDRLMCQIGGEVAQGGFARRPIIKRSLQSRRNVPRICIPSEVIRHDNQTAIALRFE